MKRPAIVGVLVLTLAAARESTAQDFFYFPENSGQFRTASVFYDNFFQEPLGGTYHEVWAGLAQLRLEETVGSSGRAQAFIDLEYVTFRELGASPGLAAGLKRKGCEHSFELEAGYQWNRPRSDVGDELEQANLLGGAGSYGHLIARTLEVKALAEYRAEFLRNQETPVSQFGELGGVIAYRAFNGRVTPEAGLLKGTRRAGNASSEYVQETMHVGVRTSLVPRLTVTIRYRQRRREYMAAQNSKNVGRVDQRESLSASFDLRVSRHLQWNLFGVTDRGESTRPGRDFAARSLGTGLTLAY